MMKKKKKELDKILQRNTVTYDGVKYLKAPGRGRPRIYRDEYCDIAYDLMAQGGSLVEVAAELGVVKDTIYKWIEKEPIFSDSIKQGKEASEAWWVSQGRKMMEAPRFNVGLYSIHMRNRFGWDKKEEKEEVNKNFKFDFSSLSTDKIVEVIKSLSTDEK